MKVKWLGHASFLITSDSGVKIITDPYTVGGGIKYGRIRESADIVTMSHGHSDHNDVASVMGKPEAVRGPGTKEIKGIKINGVATHHDEAGGSKRGENTVFCFDIDGLRLCHLGDLGHPLTPGQIADVGKVDVLLIPVGGYYTIDAKNASTVSEQLKPKVIIPMHFKTEKCDYPISDAAAFLEKKTNISRAGGSEIEFKTDKLPARTQITVLRPAL